MFKLLLFVFFVFFVFDLQYSCERIMSILSPKTVNIL